MIFFISPDSNQPIGGIKQMYRHAQILHDSGVEAFVLHGKPKQRCTWFEHHARTAYASADPVTRVTRAIGQHVGWRRALAEAPLTPGRVLFLELDDGRTQRHLLSADDVLVVPEVQTSLVERNTEGRIVVFNQNTHNTFRSLPIGSLKRSPIYSMNIVVAAVTVSGKIDGTSSLLSRPCACSASPTASTPSSSAQGPASSAASPSCRASWARRSPRSSTS